MASSEGEEEIDELLDDVTMVSALPGVLRSQVTTRFPRRTIPRPSNNPRGFELSDRSQQQKTGLALLVPARLSHPRTNAMLPQV